MFRKFFAALFAAIAGANSALRGMWRFTHDAIEEAVEPVTSRLPWLRDRALDAGDVVTGLLSVPGAILAGLLPRPALTPQAVADDAVANDDGGMNGIGGGGILPNLHGVMVLSAAKDLCDGGEAAFRQHIPHLSGPLVEWLRGLSSRDLAVACQLDAAVIERHVTATRPTDSSPLLPPMFERFPSNEPSLSQAEIDALCAKARRRVASDTREMEAMSRRGVRPLAEPTWEDEPALAVRRPAFH